MNLTEGTRKAQCDPAGVPGAPASTAACTTSIKSPAPPVPLAARRPPFAFIDAIFPFGTPLGEKGSSVVPCRHVTTVLPRCPGGVQVVGVQVLPCRCCGSSIYIPCVDYVESRAQPEADRSSRRNEWTRAPQRVARTGRRRDVSWVARTCCDAGGIAMTSPVCQNLPDRPRSAPFPFAPSHLRSRDGPLCVAPLLGLPPSLFWNPSPEPSLARPLQLARSSHKVPSSWFYLEPSL